MDDQRKIRSCMLNRIDHVKIDQYRLSNMLAGQMFIWTKLIVGDQGSNATRGQIMRYAQKQLVKHGQAAT